MTNSEIYAAITENIIVNLESSGSWVKLWQIPSPVSLNGRFYHGINRLILSSQKYNNRVYGTFGQIRSNGGVVHKGEKASVVVFWKFTQEKDESTGESKKKFLLRHYYVFNTEQADFDEQGKQKVAQLQNQVCEKVNTEITQTEAIIHGYEDKPEIIFSEKDDKAYYSPSRDLVRVPDKKYFTSSDAFYRTLFHELGHSVGHSKRLNRFENTVPTFGSMDYSREELVAELVSAYLSTIANMEANYENSTAYIKNWSDVLRENTRWILWAAVRAEKAADYILGGQDQQRQDEFCEVPTKVVPEPVMQDLPF
jgi:antirestriction protein ArdC